MSTLTPRPGIMDISPYVGGESGLAGKTRIIKLASNEGALGPSPKAIAAYRDLAGGLHRYPDGGATALRQALARHWGLDEAKIVCGAGSDELISLLCKAYAGPGDEVLYSRHGFLMYAISAKAVGATPVHAPETNLTADVDALLAAVTPRTRIVFLANPNNPTGTYLSSAELARLHAGLPENVLLVIDAAYAEFVSRNDYDDGAALVERANNVVMTRTFSKIYALGGVRLGWCYASAEIADVLNRVRGPFNVSSPALAAGEAALADQDWTDKSRAHNEAWRDWTAEKVAGLGFETTDSAGNFVLIRFPGKTGGDATAADAHLRADGIIVRRMGGYGLPDWLRVSIGAEDEMRAFVDSLARFARG